MKHQKTVKNVCHNVLEEHCDIIKHLILVHIHILLQTHKNINMNLKFFLNNKSPSPLFCMKDSH